MESAGVMSGVCVDCGSLNNTVSFSRTFGTKSGSELRGHWATLPLLSLPSALMTGEIIIPL